MRRYVAPPPREAKPGEVRGEGRSCWTARSSISILSLFVLSVDRACLARWRGRRAFAVSRRSGAGIPDCETNREAHFRVFRQGLIGKWDAASGPLRRRARRCAAARPPAVGLHAAEGRVRRGAGGGIERAVWWSVRAPATVGEVTPVIGDGKPAPASRRASGSGSSRWRGASPRPCSEMRSNGDAAPSGMRTREPKTSVGEAR